MATVSHVIIGLVILVLRQNSFKILSVYVRLHGVVVVVVFPVGFLVKMRWLRSK